MRHTLSLVFAVLVSCAAGQPYSTDPIRPVGHTSSPPVIGFGASEGPLCPGGLIEGILDSTEYDIWPYPHPTGGKHKAHTSGHGVELHLDALGPDGWIEIARGVGVDTTDTERFHRWRVTGRAKVQYALCVVVPVISIRR